MKDAINSYIFDVLVSLVAYEIGTVIDDEYVYGIKRIIDYIPPFKTAITNTLENFNTQRKPLM